MSAGEPHATFRVVTTEEAREAIEWVDLGDTEDSDRRVEILRNLLAHREHLQRQVKELQERGTMLIAARRLLKAEQEGFRAKLDGRSTNDCPYWGDEPMQAAWIAGWSEANSALGEVTR